MTDQTRDAIERVRKALLERDLTTYEDAWVLLDEFDRLEQAGRELDLEMSALKAELTTAQEAGLRHAIVPDYDYPGDAEVLAGYTCHECGGSGDRRESVEHKNCALKGQTP
jgi:hypothetical protein